MARKINTPSNKPYWSGNGGNPRTKCAICGLYMYNTSIKVSIDMKRANVICGKVCKNGHFIPDLEGLSKIPE